MKYHLRWALGAVGFLTAGCVSLLPETSPPKPRYHISASDAPMLQGEPVDWSLVLEDPRTTRIYDSVRIAVSSAPGKVEYFAGAEWADRAPRLFQTALSHTFENSGRILSIGDRSILPVGDVVLQLDIRALHLDVQSGEPNSVVSIFARLTDGKSEVFAAQRFNASAPARSERADDVVAAMDVAITTVITEIVDWTFREGENALSADS